MFKSYRQYAAWNRKQERIRILDVNGWFIIPGNSEMKFYDLQIMQYFFRDMFLQSNRKKRPKRFTHQ